MNLKSALLYLMGVAGFSNKPDYQPMEKSGMTSEGDAKTYQVFAQHEYDPPTRMIQILSLSYPHLKCMTTPIHPHSSTPHEFST